MIGVGCRPGAEVSGAVHTALAAAGLGVERIAVLATIERRAAEVREMAVACGWRLALFSAGELAEQPVPHPSVAVGGHLGTPSVAEAAALLAAGPGSALILAKRVFADVTIAIAGPRGAS